MNRDPRHASLQSLGGGPAAETPPRSLELKAALVLCSGRACGAPLTAVPHRPGKVSRRALRLAATKVVDASLDLVVAQARDSSVYDDDASAAGRESLGSAGALSVSGQGRDAGDGARESLADAFDRAAIEHSPPEERDSCGIQPGGSRPRTSFIQSPRAVAARLRPTVGSSSKRSCSIATSSAASYAAAAAATPPAAAAAEAVRWSRSFSPSSSATA